MPPQIPDQHTNNINKGTVYVATNTKPAQ